MSTDTQQTPDDETGGSDQVSVDQVEQPTKTVTTGDGTDTDVPLSEAVESQQQQSPPA